MRAHVREAVFRIALVLAVLSAAAAADADGPPSFAGTWQAGATSMDVVVESWGKDCGPQPQSTRSGGGGNVRIEQQGQVLIIRGRDRDMRSDQCWSPNPTLRRVSTSYVDGLWLTSCKTGAKDPREELGTYTLKAVAQDRLLYQDVSHFNWKLNESTCVATITTIQTLHRVAASTAQTPAQAPTPQAPVAQTPVPPAGELEPKQTCKPSAPARLTLRPRRADISLGQRICFHARVVDAVGCPIEDAALTWSLEHGPGIRAKLQAGCFEAGDGSAESEGAFKVVATSGAQRAEAGVTVSAESLQALLAKRLEAGAIEGEQAPETEVAAPTPATTVSTRVAARALSEPEPSGRRWQVALAALLAALAGLLLLIRRSAPRSRTTRQNEARTRRCPTCGASFPESSAFCGEDGSELLPPR
jgi:hypothetical protein